MKGQSQVQCSESQATNSIRPLLLYCHSLKARLPAAPGKAEHAPVLTAFSWSILSLSCSASWNSMLVLQAKASPPSAMGPVRVCLSLSLQNPRQKRMVSGPEIRGQGRLAWSRLSPWPGAKLVTELLRSMKGIWAHLARKLSNVARDHERKHFLPLKRKRRAERRLTEICWSKVYSGLF